MRVPPPSSIAAADEHILRDVHQRGARAVDQRNKDPLARLCSTALHQSCEYRRHRVLSRNDVGQRHADLHRISVRLTRDGHPTTFGLGDEIVAWPAIVLAEAGNGTPGQRGTPLHDLRWIEAVLFEYAAPEI